MNDEAKERIVRRFTNRFIESGLDIRDDAHALKKRAEALGDAHLMDACGRIEMLGREICRVAREIR